MTEENIQGNYWIHTCFMCGKEFKTACSWAHARRFCSFECRENWNKKKRFWD